MGTSTRMFLGRVGPGRTMSVTAIVATLLGLLAMLLVPLGDGAAAADDTGDAGDRRVAGGGGPVMLTGIDPELGPDDCYHGCPDTWQNVLAGLIERGRGGGGGVLVLGAAGGNVDQWWSNVVTGGGQLEDGSPFESDLGVDLTFIRDVADIEALTATDLAEFDLVGIPSSIHQVSSGGITDARNEAVNGLADELAAYVNGGGALLGHTQDRLSNPYDYISGFGEIVQSTSSSNVLDITDAGFDAGIREDFEGCCWHTSFESYPDFMEPLVYGAGGQVQVLGGRMVTVEGGAIDSVEITQATQVHQSLDAFQDAGPEVPVVEGQPAVLRVYPSTPQTTSTLFVEVSGSIDDGQLLPTVAGCSPEAARARSPIYCRSADFAFTPGSEVDVTIEVYDLSGRRVDTVRMQTDTTTTDPMVIRPTPICDSGPGWFSDDWDCGDADAIHDLLGFARRTLPTEVTVGRPAPPIRIDASDGDWDAWWDLALDSVRRRSWMEPGFHYGLARGEVGGDWAGYAYLNSRAALSLVDFPQYPDRIDGPEVTVAHELAHNLGRLHAPRDGSGFDPAEVDGCNDIPDDLDPNWPYGADPGIQEIGYDVRSGRTVGTHHFDMLAYCHGSWISPYHYEQMIGDLQNPPSWVSPTLADSAGDTPVWLVAGTFEEDHATLDALFASERAAPADADDGDYLLQSRDDDGNILDQTSIGRQQGTAHGGLDLPDSFTAVLQRDPEAVELTLEDRDGNRLGSFPVGGDGPELDILAPPAGVLVDQPTEAEWESDEDVSFLVEYTSDDGDSWEVLAAPWSSEGILLMPDELAASDADEHSRLRVTASDGVASTTVVSDGFTVPASDPSVRIVSPDDGRVAARGADLLLEASAFDVDDGGLTGNALAWESDVDGSIGTGHQLWGDGLSEGTHQLTLTGTDSHGGTDTDTITVTIDGSVPDVAISVDGDGQLGDGPGDTLLVHTGPVTGSIETSLLYAGVDLTTVQTDDIAALDLSPYDTIVAALDDGDIGDADVAALGAAVDDGSRVIGMGGVADDDFVAAVDTHLFAVDDRAQWQALEEPHLEVTAPDHPLAQDLPTTTDLSDADAAAAVLDVTDTDVEVVATDGADTPVLVDAEDGQLIWFTLNPQSAAWGASTDAAVLDQVVGNAVNRGRTVGGPVTVTVDATTTGAIPLEQMAVSLDGGESYTELTASEGPASFEIESGVVDVQAAAVDAAGNTGVADASFLVTVADDEQDPDPGDPPPTDTEPDDQTVDSDVAPDTPGAGLDWPSCEAAETVPFDDVDPVGTHADAIACASGLGLILGYGDGTYRPTQDISRAQFASILDGALAEAGHVLEEGTVVFDDVTGTHADAVHRLAAAGILQGRGASTFEPDAPIRRGQMMTLLVQANEELGVELPQADEQSFSDVADSTHEDAILRAAAGGLAAGHEDGTFRPRDAVTRGQAASFMVGWIGWNAGSES